MAKHAITIARATEKDMDNLRSFLQSFEDITDTLDTTEEYYINALDEDDPIYPYFEEVVENDVEDESDWFNDDMSDDEKMFSIFKKAFPYLCSGWRRVLLGYDALVENCCDKNDSALVFKNDFVKLTPELIQKIVEMDYSIDSDVPPEQRYKQICDCLTKDDNSEDND